MTTVDRIDSATRTSTARVQEALSLAAYLTLNMGTVEAKIMLGEHLFQLTVLLRRLRIRRSDLLLDDVPWQVASIVHPLADRLSDEPPTLRQLATAYATVRGTCSRLHDCSLDEVLDAPTTQLLEAIASCMARLQVTIDLFERSHAFVLENPSQPAADVAHIPKLPGRDTRFFVGDSRQACLRPAPIHQRAAQFHGMLMSIEIPTIEACAENILTADGLPVEFLYDMGRQAYDEARHAQALVCWLDKQRIALGAYYISYDLWQLTRERTLVDRLCIHQRLGETIGASAAHWWAQQFLTLGETAESDMYDLMYRDEVQHVAIGNRWIRHLCNGDESLIAERVQAALSARHEFHSAQGVVNGQRVYPLPPQALAAAGYSSTEIELMSSAPRA